MGMVEPIDKAWYYEPVIEFGINSSISSFFFLVLGIGNLIKIFVPKKPNLLIDLFFKFAMFFFLVLMSLATMKHSIFHVVSIFYAMSSLISASVIVRTT